MHLKVGSDAAQDEEDGEADAEEGLDGGPLVGEERGQGRGGHDFAMNSCFLLEWCSIVHVLVEWYNKTFNFNFF